MSNENKDERWVHKTYKSLYQGSVKEVIKVLELALADEENGKWKELSLEARDEDGFPTIVMTGKRRETEQEQYRRKQEEQRAKEFRQKHYEQLKKEFDEE